MPCDSRLLPNETPVMRAATVREKVQKLSEDIVSGKVKIIIGPQGSVTFSGWIDRGPTTDICAIRKLMVSGSALAKQKIAQAELLAGRKISKEAIAAGVHSHDGGKSWETH